ncbi:putative NUDIX domain-containing protein [Rosellinia necatrix]|uniref:Putative NUDIX domain-containing protein n=1 Tax=Rosellinia necatrix TaxID=77044 RepID=A0A1W2TUK3_ROSNE|nr:putative NUDIX domain-containing protein [Rosellinia necatrix]
MPDVIGIKAKSAKIIGKEQSDVVYIDRYAVRVVAFNAAGQVAVIYAKKGNYYKLPGGGIEKDEDHANAAAREVQEETGAVVKIRHSDGCVASTEEFRNDLHQTSYVYIADVVNNIGRPELTEEELADGLTHEWVPVHQALARMSSVEPTSDLGKFIQERDIYLLGEVSKKLTP